MRAAIDLDALAWLPKVELAVALTAWAVTFAGLVHLGVSTAMTHRATDEAKRSTTS